MNGSPTSTIKHPYLTQERLHSFMADLAQIDGASSGWPELNDCKSTRACAENHCPPVPSEVPDNVVLPPLSAHSVAAAELVPATDRGDSVRLCAPILPLGLPGPIDDVVLGADEQLLPSADNGGEVLKMIASLKAHSTTLPPNPVFNEFCLSGLETLQAFIPDDLVPNDLLVHDPENITNLRPKGSFSQVHTPVRYVRIFPKVQMSSQGSALRESAIYSRSPDHPVRTAHLYLKRHNRLGAGRHSMVHSAPLRLRLNTESEEESTVRVAAKTACNECGAHQMLHVEAVIYNAFPPHLMDDEQPAGVTAKMAPVKPNADAAATAVTAGDHVGKGCTTTSSTPEAKPAVVPKFYGYYAAVDADGYVIEHSHSDKFCDEDSVCPVLWPTRILLLEECGKPIVPGHHTVEQLTACLKLIERLHAAGFVQNSMYARNLMVQPGPLSAPPAERSDATPSFRIIDFGRGEVLSHLSVEDDPICKEEERKAMDRVLMLS